MGFKTWLRAGGQVEIVGDENGYWRSGHFSQRAERSIMAELLTPEEVRHLEVSEGRWHFPGPTP